MIVRVNVVLRETVLDDVAYLSQSQAPQAQCEHGRQK